jgi:hypothetical protein
VVRVVIERSFIVRPALNPGLRLPDELWTRSTIIHGPIDRDLTEQNFLRSIEHALRREGCLPEGEPFEPVVY